ncbi:MAG: EAL domain-containing response regulator [Rubrivivax sp.]|nr:EAL domain-containing response regulator [Rubrivivax sp.]
MRVLVIDDDPFARSLLARQLSELAIQEVELVDSGEAALSRLARGMPAFDALIVDLNMPGMDGVQFLRHLARQRFRGGLVLVSGEDADILRSVAKLASARRLRVAGTLHKPIALESLGQALGAVPTFAESTVMGDMRRTYDEQDLRKAIATGQLVNFYQPQVRMIDGAVAGVEALVRWQHPDDGLVFPSDFIPLVEQSGLSDELAGAVLAGALRAARQWRGAGLELRVSVNVAMDNLFALDLPEKVVNAAAEAGVPAECVVLEITESQVTRDLDRLLDVATRLRLKRVGLAIDDFGTGYSSLAQLRDVPFDELKLDRSFVHGASSNPQLQAILRATLDMARQLGLRTVAEGVEDREDWDNLRDMACDFAQGYLIARPMPAEAILNWSSDWRAKGHQRLVKPQ